MGDSSLYYMVTKEQYAKHGKELRAYAKRYREEHKEQIRAMKRREYLRYKNKILGRNRRYAIKNEDDIAEYQKEYAQKNKDVISRYKKEYHRQHEQEIRVQKREYYLQNKERLLKKNKEYYHENKKRISIYRKKTSHLHRDKSRIRYVRWYHANIEKARAYHREKMRRYSKNPFFRLGNSISHQMYLSLKSNKAGRHWESIIGYTLAELKSHLEKQFVKGMNWENYGKIWVLEHRIPKKWFKFIHPTDDDFKRCFALANLRPLFYDENLKKSDKYAEPSLSQFF